MPRLMMSRPWRCNSAALASTAKAFSSPIRPKAELIAIKAAGSGKAAPFGKAAPAAPAKDASEEFGYPGAKRPKFRCRPCDFWRRIGTYQWVAGEKRGKTIFVPCGGYCIAVK